MSHSNAAAAAATAAVPGAPVAAATAAVQWLPPATFEPSAVAVTGSGTIAAAIASDVTRASAAYNEALTYLRLASDHAKFIRNGFDPTQEVLFREADALAQALDQAREQLAILPEPVPAQTVAQFVTFVLPLVRQIIQFKERVTAAIQGCTTQQILPADFVLHLRREADFFVGILNHLAGLPTPANATLDLAGVQTAPAETLARQLIEVVPVPQAVAANLNYTEFWGKHHREHADVVSMFLRPAQGDVSAMAARFRDQFQALQTNAAALQQAFSPTDFATLNRDTLLLTDDWRNFLVNVQQAQINCSVQTNFVQRLTEHIRIETDVLAEAVIRTQLRLQKPENAALVSTRAGADYNQLTPRGIVIS